VANEDGFLRVNDNIIGRIGEVIPHSLLLKTKQAVSLKSNINGMSLLE
jgi:hypothetical protein